MTPQLILAVATGGALGSVAIFGRYRIGKAVRNGLSLGHAYNQCDWLISDWCVRRPVRSQMGLVADIAGIPDDWHLWGYTTFSTFSLDAHDLIERGQTLASSVYMVASVALSVGALTAALRLVRALS